MARANFNLSLRKVLVHEGGFQDDPADHGNWTGGKRGVGVLKGTNFGIAAHSFPHLDIRNLTVEEAGEIYKRQYWTPIRGDDLPAGLDFATFDFGVNSGTSRSAKFLQRVLRDVFGHAIAVDGAIGDITLRAVEAVVGEGRLDDLIEAFCARRLAWLKTLRGWGRFGRGWERRVNETEADALKMARGAKIRMPLPPATAEARAARDDQRQAVTRTPEGQSQIATGVGVLGSAATEAAAQIAPHTEVVPVLQYVFIALTLVGVGVGMYLAWRRITRPDDAGLEVG